MQYSKTLLVVSFCLLSACVWSQNIGKANLKGKVIDHTGAPLPYATITIDSLNLGNMSDSLGDYQILNLPPGKHKVSVSGIGYKKKTQTVVLKENQTLKLDLKLTEEVHQLNEIALGYKKTEKEKIEESGFAVKVIETEEAAIRNLQTNELLDRAVGVKVRQNGGLGSSVEYNLNGMSGRSVGIFIDGIEISTYGTSFNLNNIPPAMIERIEVYKGVLPAHLSGDYLGGAINIILKQDLTLNNVTLSTSYGSFNTSQTDLSGVYRDPKTGVTVKASGFYSYSDNDYKIWGRFARNTLPDGRMVNVTANRFNDAYKTYGTRVEAGFTKVKWADNFLISYNGSYSYKEIQHGQYMTIPYMGRFTESRANVIGLNYTKRNFLTKGLHIQFNGVYTDRDQYVQDTVSYRYNWYGEKEIGFHGEHRKTDAGAQQGAPTMMTINRKLATIRTSVSYDLSKKHRFILNYYYYNVDRNDLDEIKHVSERKYLSTSDLAKSVTSLAYESRFIRNRLKTNLFAKHYNQIIDRVSPYADDATGAYMENHTSNSKSTIGYGLAATYDITHYIMLLASAEKAVRMPAEQEIFGGPAENIVANTDLRPELSNNINLGLRLGNFYLGRHRVMLSGNFFNRDVRDRIGPQAEDRRVNENTQFIPFINLNKAQAIGFESELTYNYNDKLNLLLSLSKTNSLFKQKYDKEGKKLPRYNDQIPNEPVLLLSTSFQYRLTDIIQKKSVLTFNYYFGYVHPFKMTWVGHDTEVTPAQYIQDAGITYRFPKQKLVLSFDVKNIFDRQLYDNFAVQKPGRGYYAKVTYTLNKLKL